METIPISAAKARLNDVVEQAVSTHQWVTITKNGAPAAVVISAEEWESIQETLFWLSQDGVREDVSRGRAEHASDETLTEAEVRAQLGRPARR